MFLPQYYDDHDDDHHEDSDEPIILRYFVGNEILFTYDSRHTNRESFIAEAIQHTHNLLERFETKSKFEACQVTILPESVYVIERQNRLSEATPRFFALIKVVIQPSSPLDLEDTTNDIRLYEHIDHMVGQLLEEGNFPFLNRTHAQPEKTASIGGDEPSLPEFWNYEQAPHVELALRSISPNWLTGAATHANGHSITGGPGTPAQIVQNPVNPSKLEFNVQGLTKQAGNRPVRVFILDSGISTQTMSRLKAVVTQNPLAAKLVNVLAKSASVLTSQSTWAADSKKIASAISKISAKDIEHGICDHDIGMLSQHGLFIAGIIHTLAPNAEIYVLPAMNDYGAGSTESIIACLEAIAHFSGNMPTIINTSFSLVVAAQEAQKEVNAQKVRQCGGTANATAIVDKVTTPDSAATQQEAIKLTLMREWLHSLASELSPSNTAIIAAAGNDSTGRTHLQPRYPARYNDVIGVAASEANGIVADYSNSADLSTTATPNIYGPNHKKAVIAGFIALGSVRGLYLHNKNGTLTSLADWSGTSFAAAVTSGVLAGLLTGNLAPTPNQNLATIEASLAFMTQIAPTNNTLNAYPLSIKQG